MRFFFLLLFAVAVHGALAFGAQELTLLISAGRSTLSASDPLPLTLHFLNTGARTIWLYRPVEGASSENTFEGPPAGLGESGPTPASGGSTLEVSLVPANPSAAAAPASAAVLEPVGMPHPNLVRLPPGESDEEQVLIHLAPNLAAAQDAKAALRGAYKISVVYRARYSNGDEIERTLGVDLWRAEVTSNALEISLRPADGQGSISGAVANSVSERISGMLVSLSDERERTLDQVRSDRGGQFSFQGLPWGLYWVTVRRPDASEDTAIFEHAVLSQASPSASVDLMMIPSSPYKPNQLLHKPVLVRVDDPQGRPLAGVQLQTVFSNGSVVDNVKGETAEDGSAVLALIPGRNFLTLKKRGCAGEDRRMDVAPGGGVDAFRFDFSCAKK